MALLMIALLMSPTHPFFEGFDQWWHSISRAPEGYKVSGIVAFLDAFGRPPGMIVLPVLLLILGVTRRWWAMLLTFCSYIIPISIAQLVKHLVDRERPADPLVIVDHGSFPSGHVVSTAAFVILIAALLSPKIRRYWWPLAAIFLIAMMWSRTFLAAHWATDTIAGACLGGAVMLMLWWLWEPLLNKDAARRRRASEKRASAHRPSASKLNTTSQTKEPIA